MDNQSTRPPLVPARRSRTREVNSRYKSPISTRPKRYPAPNTSKNSPLLVPKRAISAERTRLSTQSSPPSPHVEALLAARKTLGTKLPEPLIWPSTMRSLNVSFQSNTISVPVSRTEKEKPVNHTPSDRALRPSSNDTWRNPTPERKMSPHKGKNFSDQMENSTPLDRIVEQHRWPSGKTSSGTPSLRRLSLGGAYSNTLQKSASELLLLISRDERVNETLNVSSFDDSLLRVKRPPSSRSRPSSPYVCKGISPARVRQSSPSRQPQNTTSVLSFIADIKKGYKSH